MNKNVDRVLVFLLICSFCLTAWIFFNMDEDGLECSKSPLSWGLNNMEIANKEQILCSCHLLSAGSHVMNINSSTVWYELPPKVTHYEPIENLEGLLANISWGVNG